MVDPLVRLSKRQRLEQPLCWMDCETIATVVAPVGVGVDSASSPRPDRRMLLSTPIASALTEEIFLDRLAKEILIPFRFSLSNQIQLLDEDAVENDTVSAAKERRRCLQSRLCIGLNACLRLLEEATAATRSGGTHLPTCTATPTKPTTPAPQLVVLASEAATASTSTAAHQAVAVWAHQVGTPLLVLPNTSSRELGRRFGTKHVTAVAFVSSPLTQQQPNRALHNAVDSFVAFVRDKVPPQK